MITMLLAAGTAAADTAAPQSNYGLGQMLQQGGVISWSVFIILVFMLVVSLYILFTKLFEQQKVRNEAKRVRAVFWQAPNIREGAAKLDKNGAYRQLVDDGLNAQDQFAKLTDPVEAHDWLHGSLARSEATINSDLNSGLAFLATVGATAPFIGLFGTVIGIYRALISLGSSGGTPGIDKVAGPVGEALIMTALGLVTAVPAVLAYNWLQRRNKAIGEDLSAFSNDVLGYLASNGAVRPEVKGKAPAAKPATATTGAAPTRK
ncbi:MAG: MotA/TolQ/ExbB proton channel family protein [Sphingomonas sp.]